MQRTATFSGLAVALLCSLSQADIISGTVKEAGGGPLADARVQIDPLHFTLSGADGKFTLNTGEIVDVKHLISPKTQGGLAYHADRQVLTWNGLDGSARISVRDMNGFLVTSPEQTAASATVSLAALPQGNYVATVLASGHAPMSLVLNTLAGFSAAEATGAASAAFAKTAATNNLGCYHTGHVSVFQAVDGSKSDVVIEMTKDPVGLGYHDYVFAGEWQHHSMSGQNLYVIKGGKVVWQYTMPGSGEYGDVSMLKDGNILFTRGTAGAAVITPDKKLVWEYKTRGGDAQVHTSQPIGPDKVFIAENGAPLLLSIWNWKTNTKLWENKYTAITGGTHGQMRHSRFLSNGHLLLGTMKLGSVIEYDTVGMKELWKAPAKSCWAAVRLPNGNTLWSGNGGGTATEIGPKGDTVWQIKKDEFKASHGFSFATVQECMRLKNGNTIINNWLGASGEPQIVEVTPDKKIVWILKSWANPDLQYGSSTDILDEPGYMEDFEHYR
jgi:hypothetical protein